MVESFSAVESLMEQQKGSDYTRSNYLHHFTNSDYRWLQLSTAQLTKASSTLSYLQCETCYLLVDVCKQKYNIYTQCVTGGSSIILQLLSHQKYPSKF